MVIHILQVRKLNWTDGITERHTEIVDGFKGIIWTYDVKPIESVWIVSLITDSFAVLYPQSWAFFCDQDTLNKNSAFP